MTYCRCTIVAIVAVLLVAVATAQHALASEAADATSGVLPRDLEVQLALSALPRHLRADATVYVLNPASGFEMFRKGTNGFQPSSLEPVTIPSEGRGRSRNIATTFSIPSDLTVPAPRGTCESSLMQPHSRRRVLPHPT